MGNIPLEKTLQREFYLEKNIFEQEQKNIFANEWYCAGRESEIPGAGDYVLRKVAGQCIIVTRNEDGSLKAFFNLCRHRGAELVNTSQTESRFESEEYLGGKFPGSIRCPYHSWTYELDGTLRMAAHIDASIAEFRNELSLHEAGIGTWGGFFFIKVNKENGPVKSLSEQLGEIPDRVKRYGLQNLIAARRISYAVSANWKVILENYNECYHCGPVHPELCEVVPVFREAGGQNLDWDDGIPHRDGADTFTFSGTSSRASFPDLDENEKIRHKGELIYPNLMISLSREHVSSYRVWPVDVDRTIIVNEFLFHPDEVNKPGFDPFDAVEFWDLVNKQDWRICESVQRGMNSSVFEHGYYAPMEDYSLDIRNYFKQRMPGSGN